MLLEKILKKIKNSSKSLMINYWSIRTKRIVLKMRKEKEKRKKESIGGMKKIKSQRNRRKSKKIRKYTKTSTNIKKRKRKEKKSKRRCSNFRNWETNASKENNKKDWNSENFSEPTLWTETIIKYRINLSCVTMRVSSAMKVVFENRLFVV